MDDIFWTTSSGRHLLDDIFWTTSSGRHLMDDIFWTTSSGRHLLDDIFWTTSSGRHLLDDIFWTTSSGRHLLDDILWTTSSGRHLMDTGAAGLWSNLPNNIKCTSSLHLFKKRLKTFFKNILLILLAVPCTFYLSLVLWCVGINLQQLFCNKLRMYPRLLVKYVTACITCLQVGQLLLTLY